MNVFKSVTLTKDFFSMEEADKWIDGILVEFDDYRDAFTSLNYNGLGVYTARVDFNQEYIIDGLVREDSGEPDLFNTV